MRVNYRLKPRVVTLVSTGPIELGPGFHHQKGRTMALDAVDGDGRRVFVAFTDEQAERLISALAWMRDRDWYRRHYRDNKTGAEK
jgi:hypothetical protein